MMTGNVALRQANLTLVIYDSVGGEASVDAVIDTGFNGYLTLPPALIRLLNLPLSGSRPAILGDGIPVDFALHRGMVRWYGVPREVQVLAVEGEPLIGMGSSTAAS
jgi:clan AA aspartic protease